jgi:hypothetical protein
VENKQLGKTSEKSNVILSMFHLHHHIADPHGNEKVSRALLDEILEKRFNCFLMGYNSFKDFETLHDIG